MNAKVIFLFDEVSKIGGQNFDIDFYSFELTSVFAICFLIGIFVGAIVFDIFSRRWFT